MRRVSVVTHARTYTHHFVRRDARSHAAAADQHAALGFPVEHRPPYGLREVRIVRWIFVECAHVQHIMFQRAQEIDRKSTRLNSSHLGISYAVFCLKKKKINTVNTYHTHNDTKKLRP